MVASAARQRCRACTGQHVDCRVNKQVLARVQQVSAARLHVLHQQISRSLAEGEEEATPGEVPGSEVVLDAQAFISDHLRQEVHRGTAFARTCNVVCAEALCGGVSKRGVVV